MYVRCIQCGHDNGPQFRFCGMCGAPLEHPRTEVAPPQAGSSEAREVEAGDGEREIVHEPSFPGLAEDPKAEFHSLYEDEPSRSRVGVVVFLLIILGAVGFLAWQWGHGGFPFHQQTSTQPSRTSPTTQSASSSEVTPAVNQSGQEAANRSPGAPEGENKTAETRQNPPAPAKASRGRGTATADPNATSAGENPPPPTAPDFELEQAGERYLYGNGVSKGCSQAQSKLSTAATHGNPKAQIVLGTMYATGHCVGRDLPAAYRWFARARRHEPHNSRIAQDLQVLWREMTPEERQLAKAS